MESIIALVAMGIVVLPLILSIIAFRRSSIIPKLQEQLLSQEVEIARLKKQLAHPTPTPPITADTSETRAPEAFILPRPATPPPLPPVQNITPTTAVPPAFHEQVIDKTPDAEDEYALKKSKASLSQDVFSYHTESAPKSHTPIFFAWLQEVNKFVLGGLSLLGLGVAFFLQYAYAKGYFTFPIEGRFIVIATLSVALTGIGVKTARKRPDFGLLLQGGGLAILFLTIFTAYKMQVLVTSATLSFSLLASVTIIAVTLALLQNSFSLAFFAFTGAFFVPFLATDGSGSHTTLFGYYLILNVGIAIISYFKQWNPLFVMGFYFTFVLSTFWGIVQYQSAYFTTTEPFLLTFWVLYILMALFFALNQPPKLKGFVDGTLLFGVPIAALALQIPLVHQFPKGIAYTCFGASIVYMMAGLLLRRFRKPELTLMTQSLFGIAILFATLAIPFSFSNETTTAIWALEGAAILWLSQKQHRPAGVLFGVILQYGAGLYLLLNPVECSGSLPFINSAYLSVILIALASFFSAYTQQKNSTISHSFFVWATLWFYLGSLSQIDMHILSESQWMASLILFMVSGILFLVVGTLLAWAPLQTLFLFLPIMIVLAYLEQLTLNPSLFNTSLGLTIVGAVTLWYVAMTMVKNIAPFKDMHAKLHLFSSLFVMLLITVELQEQLQPLFTRLPELEFVTLPIVPLVFLWTLFYLPLAKTYKNLLVPIQGAIIVAGTLVWALLMLFHHAPLEAIPYIPLLNPLEALQLVVLVSWVAWYKEIYQKFSKDFLVFLNMALFLLISTMVIKSVATYTATSYELLELFTSAPVQTAISITWTLYSWTFIIVASQRKNRELWLVGATLFCGTIGKLFLVDLAASNEIVKIVSFIFTGIVMLLIGYFNPLPPKSEKSLTEKATL